ncbi:hypothetical protein BDV11DRAFT_193532 [Aspergillus similis]
MWIPLCICFLLSRLSPFYLRSLLLTMTCAYLSFSIIIFPAFSPSYSDYSDGLGFGFALDA